MIAAMKQSMIIILHAKDLKKGLRLIKGAPCLWLYLGKDVMQKTSILAKLGKKNYHHIGNLLQEIARNEKNAFINMVADLGLGMKNKLSWWASNISYKNPLSSDLFLHWCYVAVFKRLFEAESKQPRGPFLVFVENRWLYKYLWMQYKQEQDRFCFLSKKSVFTEVIRLITNGLMSNLFTLLAIINNKRRRYRKPDAKGHTHVLIESNVNSFKKEGEYIDRNFAVLKELAAKMNTDITYNALPSIGSGIRGNILKAVKENFVLLDQYTGMRDMIRSMRAFPAMAQLWTVGERFPAFSGLFQYEVLRDIGPLFKNMLTYCAAKRWFKETSRPITLIYPFENQPSEKMLCMAGEANTHISLAGYQCSGVSNFLLNFFPGKADYGNMPVPHSIITSGKYTQKLFENAGYGDAQIINGGSFRYEYLHHINQDEAGDEKKSDIKTVVVAFTYSVSLTLEMLMALFDAFANKGDKSCHFILKFHPSLPPESLKVQLPSWPPHFEVSGQSFAEALERADLVLYSSSTAGLEAYLAGVPLIRYDSEHNLSVDPLDALDESTVQGCSASNMKSVILSQLRDSISPAPVSDEPVQISYFFSLPDLKMWRNLVADNTKESM
jgi:hypothetical protein